MWTQLWHRCKRCALYNVVRLFRIRSATEKVARGFAVGLMVNFAPTFGFGVVISGFLARFVGGSAVAGFIGGAMLAFAWPLLFLLNVKMGAHFIQPSMAVNELEDVTEKTVNALVWGQTFMVGAILNSILVGGTAYLLIRWFYSRIRPRALEYFRRHSREHTQRIRRLAPRISRA
jgi:uncharacterized protein (DUF2062 family)